MKKKREEILYFGGAGSSLLKAGGFSWSLKVLWRKRENNGQLSNKLAEKPRRLGTGQEDNKYAVLMPTTC
jgi:hypothetical protein